MNLRVFLIGGFNKTKYLANSLIKKGHKVTAINNSRENCLALTEIDKLTVFHGDGSKPFILEDADVYDADIAIALTNSDADNFVICELCKKKFNVKKTVTLITDPRKIDFFHSVGIDLVVCAVSTISSIIEQQAFFNELTTIIPIGESRIKISQLPVSDTAPVVNKKMKDINWPKQIVIGCIQRGEKSMVPRGDTRIHAGDILLLISSDEHETAAVQELAGR